jgi:hypothetical protein
MMRMIDIPAGEVSLVDKEHPNRSTDMLHAIIDVDGSVSKRNVSLFPTIVLEHLVE